jgi:hypothetical protein
LGSARRWMWRDVLEERSRDEGSVGGKERLVMF